MSQFDSRLKVNAIRLKDTMLLKGDNYKNLENRHLMNKRLSRYICWLSPWHGVCPECGRSGLRSPDHSGKTLFSFTVIWVVRHKVVYSTTNNNTSCWLVLLVENPRKQKNITIVFFTARLFINNTCARFLNLMMIDLREFGYWFVLKSLQ